MWLVRNPASGSNDDATIDALHECCGANGFSIDRIIAFPDDDLVTPEELDRAGVETVAIFSGDGTMNAQIPALYGWGGKILPLPGGTMNLLSRRLHGEASVEEIVARAAGGTARRTRPNVIRSEYGDAFSGILAGPAARWGDVREAMRDFDIIGVASGTVEAVAESTTGVMARCEDPRVGRDEGFPLILLSPCPEGIALTAYYSDTAGKLVQQVFALMKRDFREGPHEDLGAFREVTIASVENAQLDLLIDGEQAVGERRVRFDTVECEVDLVTTIDG